MSFRTGLIFCSRKMAIGTRSQIVRFAGLSLLQRVEIDIQSSRTFTNSSLVMMQVAKQSICAPTAAKKTIFGN